MRALRIAAIAIGCLSLSVPASAQPFVYVGTTGPRVHASICALPDANCSGAAVELFNAASGSRMVSDSFGPAGLAGFTGGDYAVAPDGNRIYAMTFIGLMSFEVFSNEFRPLIATATTGAIAVSPDGHELFVATGQQLKVLDTSTFAQTASIALPATAHDVAISPDGLALYVSYNDADLVSRVSPITRTVEVTSSGLRRGAVATSADGSRLYLVSIGSVRVVDTATLTQVATISIPLPPRYPASTPVGRIVVTGMTAYVSDSGSPAIAILDLSSNTVRDVITGIEQAGGLSLSQDGRDLFIAYAKGVMRMDTASHALTHVITTDSPGSTVAVLPPQPCLFEATVSPRAVPLGGGTITVDVPAAASCAWTASSEASWFVATPDAGTGPGTISVVVPPATEPRASLLRVAAHEIEIRQTSPDIRVDTAGGQILTQPAVVTGWAIDREGRLPTHHRSSTGVDTVHVWAYPLPSGAPRLVGIATYGLPRADVSAMYGSRYHPSGFSIEVRGLPTGSYNFVFFAHSSVTQTFSAAALVPVNVRRAPVTLVVDAPAAGSVVRRPFAIGGWAIDAASLRPPGVDAVDVWAYPASGAAPQFVGSASYGGARPDVGAIFGTAFTGSGFNLLADLPPGSYQLAVFPRAADTGLFEPAVVVPITVAASNPRMHVDVPAPSAIVPGSFAVGGWALDLAAGAGPGVDAIHIWAYPLAGGAPVRVGVAAPTPRPDVAAVFGSQYLMSGFHLADATLPDGGYDLVVFAHSSVTGTFNNSFVVRITSRHTP